MKKFFKYNLILVMLLFILPSKSIGATSYSTYIASLPAIATINSQNSLLATKLDTEINNMIVSNGSGGYVHLRPRLFNNGGNIGGYGIAYWDNIGELISTLSKAYPYVSGATQIKIKAYLSQEMSSYNPLTNAYMDSGVISNMPGVNRQLYSIDESEFLNAYSGVYQNNFGGSGYPLVNISIAYPLWEYSFYTGDNKFYTGANWNSLKSLYNNFKSSYNSGSITTISGKSKYYYEIIGLTGFSRLATLAQDSSLALESATYASMALNPANGLNNNVFSTYIANSDSLMQGTQGVSPNRQTASLFAQANGNMLFTTVFARELLQFLRDNENSAISIYSQNLEKFNPLWYLTYPAWGANFTLNVGNAENMYSPPEMGWTNFMIHAYVKNESLSQLSSYIDFPTSKGDLYFLNELVSAIEAPQGNLRGDFNGDNKVNVIDLSILLTKLGTIDPIEISNYDLNNSNSVNVIHLSIFLTLLG